MVHILYDIGEYNVGYDISAFLMLAVILIFRLLQIKKKSHSMHLLIATTILQAITSLLEAFSCVMRNNPLLFSPETGNLVNFSGYLLNTTVIYLVVLYILSLTGVNKTLSVWQKWFVHSPICFLPLFLYSPGQGTGFFI